jgi:uncharacterized protein (DUF1800 family)
MLLAVARHPAMLIYLDNARSFGPNSRLGRKRNRGLNENLAREILELHTLGVDGGYEEGDVRALARILTGWTVRGPRQSNTGKFQFFDQAHEPGDKTFLGRRIAESGASEGETALRLLARHPATAHNVARKLVSHFMADLPPPDAVERVAATFLDSGGDLRAVSQAVASLPEAWQTPGAKFKSANDYVVSALRLVDLAPDDRPLVGSLKILGQLPWMAPSPAGWPDDVEAWAGPEALLARADWAGQVARRLPIGLDPKRLAKSSLGGVAADETRRAVARAPSRVDALTLVLAGPAFQWR